MGDRVLMQVVNNEGEFGPVVYCVWSWSNVPKFVKELKKRMSDRQNDIPYSTANLAQIAMGNDADNLGFGIWNATAILTAEDSHGDAGVVLIDF